MNRFEEFLQLHYNERPLLLGNAWDVTSAKAFEQNGFKAIATSSRALAHSMGYDDGEKMPFDLLLQAAKMIIKQINVPFSVDIERGYGCDAPEIIQNIERLYDLGVVGFNIEDSSRNDRKSLQAMDDFVKIISSIADHLDKKNMKMFLNARTDAFLLRLPSPLEETVKRVKAYENAGATGIFVPFIRDRAGLRQIVETTKLPINVVCTAELSSIKELLDLGVRRISMGGAVHEAMARKLERTLQTILEDQSFESLFQVSLNEIHG